MEMIAPSLNIKDGNVVKNRRRETLRIKVAFAIFILLFALVLTGQIFALNRVSELTDLSAVNLPPLSAGHFLGTDSLGHDVFVMACLGAKTSLLIGFIAATIAVSFGFLWGALGATSGKLTGSIMMRIVDALLSIPTLILLLALTALIRRPDFTENIPLTILEFFKVTDTSLGLIPVISIIAVIASSTWLEAARISYSKISTINLEEYVLYSRSLGAGNIFILTRHLIPNAARIILIQTTLLVSDAVVMEAGLSFLGLGLGPDVASWGGMLRQAPTDLFYANWWAPLVPALLISLTILSINLFGEGMLMKAGQDNKLH